MKKLYDLLFTRKNLFFFLLFVLVVVQVLIHRAWLFSSSPLVSGDWPYFYPNLLKKWFPFYDNWITYDGLGRTISQGNFVFIYSVFGILAKLGVSFEIISRMLFFLPVAILAPISSFIALNGILKNKIAAVVGSFVYLFNTYFIVIQGGHMQLSMVYALAPFTYYFASQKIRNSYFLLFFVLGIMCLYDIRTTLLVGLFAFVIAFFYKVKNRSDFIIYFRNILIGFTVLIYINLFWVLPSVFTKSSQFSKDVFSQSPLNWITQTDALTIHHPFWSNSGVTDFVLQKPSIILYILPLLAFSSFIYAKKKDKYKRELIFYGFITLITVMFLIQENSFVPEIYHTLYTHIPLLSAYRESSKLFIISAYCYSALIGFLLLELKRSKSLLREAIVIVAVLISTLIPISVYILGNFTKTYKQESISTNIKKINNDIMDTNENYRNLWVSRIPKFATATTTNPSIDALNLGQSYWGKYADANDPLSYLREPYTRALIDFAGVKNVIVSADLIDPNFHHYNYQPALYYADIVNTWGIKPNIRVGNSTLWKNDNYKPYIYFSTKNTKVNSISVYSGINDSKTSSYLFEDQNTKSKIVALDKATNNLELNPFQPKYLNVKPNLITSSYSIPSNLNYNLYFKKKDQMQSTFGDAYKIINNYDTSKQIVAVDKSITGKNLYNNGSFENGSEIKVNDCNNYDHTSKNQNKISGVLVNDSTNGKKALSVSAEFHIACYSKKIENFKQNANYLISIDYKKISGLAPYISLYPYNNNPETRHINLPVDGSRKWKHFQTILKPGNFTDSLYFIVNLPTNNKEISKTLIDNIQVQKLDNIPYIYLKSDSKPIPTVKISTIINKPTEHKINVKNLKEPHLFVFSETFDPNWILTIKNQSQNSNNMEFASYIKGKPDGYKINENAHIVANGFANSWWINPKSLPKNIQNKEGNYVFTVEYMPERWVHIGTFLSALTFVGCLSYLGYDWRKNRHTTKYKNLDHS